MLRLHDQPRLTQDSWRDAQACAVSTCMRHGMRAHRSSPTPLDQRPCSRGSRQPHVRRCPVHDAPLGRGSWRVRTRAGCTVMRDAGLRAVARVEDAPNASLHLQFTCLTRWVRLTLARAPATRTVRRIAWRTEVSDTLARSRSQLPHERPRAQQVFPCVRLAMAASLRARA